MTILEQVWFTAYCAVVAGDTAGDGNYQHERVRIANEAVEDFQTRFPTHEE